MDLLTGNVRKLYFKFLSAAFGSALITSIYGMMDMAMVGQYQGPDGAAAVLTGGIFNVFGDWFCVFALDLGVFGAGLAMRRDTRALSQN